GPERGHEAQPFRLLLRVGDNCGNRQGKPRGSEARRGLKPRTINIGDLAAALGIEELGMTKALTERCRIDRAVEARAQQPDLGKCRPGRHGSDTVKGMIGWNAAVVFAA